MNRNTNSNTMIVEVILRRKAITGYRSDKIVGCNHGTEKLITTIISSNVSMNYLHKFLTATLPYNLEYN